MSSSALPPTQRTQTLASGLTIRQDFTAACRFVFFNTGLEVWPYATHGGTAFVVNVEGQFFGLTAKHVLGDFAWPQIMITDQKHGQLTAGIRNVFTISTPSGDAVGSDVLDIAVIQFSEDVDASFFKDSTYIIDHGTVGRSFDRHELLVNGIMKDQSAITEEAIAPRFALVQLADDGAYEADGVLRRAIGKFQIDEITSVTGFSGAPVFDSTTSKLCGMVVRGSLVDQFCQVFYIDAFDIMQVLLAIRHGRSDAAYRKGVLIRRENPK